jgi:histidinol-phosphate aminotransferase
MRLGYAIAPAEMIDRMRPHAIGSINTAVRWAGVASLADAAGQAEVSARNAETKQRTVAALETSGFHVLPSQANFFMVDIKREVAPVIQAFRERGIAVGRQFPPMTKHLRVSIGTPEEMTRFLERFAEIVQAPKTTAGGPGA